MSEVVAAILLVGITAYALFGGADFGAGFWDLVAGGAARGERPRSVVNHSIGPVWEANHVWLIFILVVLWTAFSPVFQSVMLTLFVPLSVAALGIVLRGSGFAFRKEVVTVAQQRNFGAAFALSSVLVPFCMGAVAGAVASGRVPAGGHGGDLWTSWLNPTSILGGTLAVTVCAYLAAVYMVWDARRLSDAAMTEYFRRRAVAAAMVAGVVALAGIFVLAADASYVFHGLTSRALPFVIAAGAFGTASLILLVRGAHSGARLLAAGAVASVIVAWGVAQYPYLLPTSTEIDAAAAPSATLGSVIVVFAVAAAVIVPSLGLLYLLDQRNLVESETEAERAASDSPT